MLLHTIPLLPLHNILQLSSNYIYIATYVFVQVMKGYFSLPAEAAGIKDGWFFTGDLGM